MRIAVSANFVAEGIASPLTFLLSRLGLTADLWFAPFDQIQQQLLEFHGMFAKSDFRVILVQTERWMAASDAMQALSPFLQSFIALVRGSFNVKSAAPLLVVFAPSSLKEDRIGPITKTEDAIKSSLSSLENLNVITSTEIKALYPDLSKANLFDSYLTTAAAAPFNDLGLATLATLVARNIYLQIRPQKKVVALDCDNTLWAGNCGERNLTELRFDTKHLLIQEFFVAQSRSGRIICLCSKNDESSVLNVVDKHPEMILNREHLASWRINWNPKVNNLLELAKELQVNLDSFIFVDDDPFECAAIRKLLPQVLTIHLPQDMDENGVKEILNSNWDLDFPDQLLTPEDRMRNSFYRENKHRQDLLKGSITFSDFLVSLDLRVNILPLAHATIDRISQLTKRTNQFNLNALPWTHNDLAESLQNPVDAQWTVQASDRFGDYGIVGFIKLRCHESVLKVHSFLLSCRALGRGIERKMLGTVFEESRARSVEGILFDYRPTERNRPIARLLSKIGALDDEESPVMISTDQLANFLALHEDDAGL